MNYFDLSEKKEKIVAKYRLVIVNLQSRFIFKY